MSMCCVGFVECWIKICNVVRLPVIYCLWKKKKSPYPWIPILLDFIPLFCTTFDCLKKAIKQNWCEDGKSQKEPKQSEMTILSWMSFCIYILQYCALFPWFFVYFCKDTCCYTDVFNPITYFVMNYTLLAS